MASVTAPGGATPYVLEGAMVKEYQFWFSSSTALALAHGPAAWTAAYDLSGTPRSWTPSQTQTVSITVRNNGNQVWPAGGATPFASACTSPRSPAAGRPRSVVFLGVGYGPANRTGRTTFCREAARR